MTSSITERIRLSVWIPAVIAALFLATGLSAEAAKREDSISCLPKLKSIGAVYDSGRSKALARRQVIVDTINSQFDKLQSAILGLPQTRELFQEILDEFNAAVKVKYSKDTRLSSQMQEAGDDTFFVSTSESQTEKINEILPLIEAKIIELFDPVLTKETGATCVSHFFQEKSDHLGRFWPSRLSFICLYKSKVDEVVKSKVKVSIWFPYLLPYYDRPLVDLKISIADYGEFGKVDEDNLYFVLHRSGSKDLLSESPFEMDTEEFDREDFQITSTQGINSDQFSENLRRLGTNPTHEKESLIFDYIEKDCTIPGNSLIGEWDPFAPYLYNTDTSGNRFMSLPLTDVFPAEMLAADTNLLKPEYQNPRGNTVTLYFRDGQHGAVLSAPQQIDELKATRTEQLQKIRNFKATGPSYCWVNVTIPANSHLIQFPNPIQISRQYVSWASPIDDEQEVLTTLVEVFHPDFRYIPEGEYSRMTRLVCQQQQARRASKSNFRLEEVLNHLSPGNTQIFLFQQQELERKATTEQERKP